jgi:outer membrane receptor protein involved in Fe transport
VRTESAYCTSLDYTVVFAGNPDLNPEESENYNLGVAWRPSSDFQVSVDYWDIKQTDKIDRVPVEYLYNTFCQTQDSTVCTRGAPLGGDTLGALQSINSSFINIGEQHVNGVDLNASYAMPMAAGLLTLGSTTRICSSSSA